MKVSSKNMHSFILKKSKSIKMLIIWPVLSFLIILALTANSFALNKNTGPKQELTDAFDSLKLHAYLNAAKAFKKSLSENYGNNHPLDLFIGLSFASAMIGDYNTAFEASIWALESEKINFEYFKADEICLFTNNYQRLIFTTPSVPELHFALASLHMLTKNYGHAEERFKLAAAINPDCFEYQFYYAETLFIEVKYRAAAKIYEKAIAIDFESFEAHDRLYKCYATLKDSQAAEAELKIIEKLSGGSTIPPAQN